MIYMKQMKILNNLKEALAPGMSLEETLLNTKILEEWFNA